MMHFARLWLSCTLIAILVGCEGSGTVSSSPQGTAPANDASLQVGDQCILTAKGSAVFVYPEYEDMDEVLNALIAKDDIGLQKLQAAGKYFVCPAMTRAQLIENGILARRVRILGGGYYGEDGWVPTEFVLPAAVSDEKKRAHPENRGVGL